MGVEDDASDPKSGRKRPRRACNELHCSNINCAMHNCQALPSTSGACAVRAAKRNCARFWRRRRSDRHPRRALHGATAQQTKAPQRPWRYEADEIDFALRNISGNTQLSAGMRRAWPSRTASCSEMRDRYWRVLNISVELFETFTTLGRSPHSIGWSHADAYPVVPGSSICSAGTDSAG